MVGEKVIELVGCIIRRGENSAHQCEKVSSVATFLTISRLAWTVLVGR